MKIHTSNPKKVEEKLKEITIQGSFWDYNLTWEMDDTHLKFNPLNQEDYFDLPEFKWSDSLKERFVFNVNINNQTEKDACKISSSVQCLSRVPFLTNSYC